MADTDNNKPVPIETNPVSIGKHTDEEGVTHFTYLGMTPSFDDKEPFEATAIISSDGGFKYYSPGFLVDMNDISVEVNRPHTRFKISTKDSIGNGDHIGLSCLDMDSFELDSSGKKTDNYSSKKGYITRDVSKEVIADFLRANLDPDMVKALEENPQPLLIPNSPNKNGNPTFKDIMSHEGKSSACTENGLIVEKLDTSNLYEADAPAATPNCAQKDGQCK
jgi:hypothetical protein